VLTISQTVTLILSFKKLFKEAAVSKPMKDEPITTIFLATLALSLIACKSSHVLSTCTLLKAPDVPSGTRGVPPVARSNFS